jgi:peptidoglycan/LPS O-acetylase OafA/YrhL
MCHPKYRADIDGLRAIAVLSVVSYHASPIRFKGGFIGVDIFFVISGFLISTIIFENLQGGNFSFVDFYGRRIRRIFPALIIVLMACFIAGWLLLLPDEYKQLGRHIAGGSGFASNFILWNESGYFDNAADTKPLLHLWSLGIEEQFYIVWPVFLWALWKGNLNWLMAIMTLAAISFVLNVRGVHSDPVAAFYSPQTRFWELLVGSTLAYLTLYEGEKIRAFRRRCESFIGRLSFADLSDGHELRNVQTLLGMAAIISGVVLFTRDSPFPGTWALLPTLGAALVIAAGSKAWFNRAILANPVLVWFGLVSYPLYLWHWPLISFATIVENGTPSRIIRITAVVISIVLAWLTYRLIERPIRFGGLNKEKALALCFTMVLLGGFGYWGTHHLDDRYENAIRNIELRGLTSPADARIDAKREFATIGDNPDSKIMLLGDSHAHQYQELLADLHNARVLTNPRVPEIIYNYYYLTIPGLLNASEKIASDPTISSVIFSEFWAYDYRSDQVNYAIRCCGPRGLVGGSSPTPLTPDEISRLDDSLEKAASILTKSGKKVYFVLDNPFGEEFDARSIVKRSLFHPPRFSLGGVKRTVAIQRDEPARTRIINIAKKSDAEVIDPYKYLCDEEMCPAFSPDGNLLYKDYDHLSQYALKNLVRYFDFLMPPVK